MGLEVVIASRSTFLCQTCKRSDLFFVFLAKHLVHNQFVEVAVDESLEMNTSTPKFSEIGDLSKEDKLDISVSREFKSQVSLTESSESLSASDFITSI